MTEAELLLAGLWPEPGTGTFPAAQPRKGRLLTEARTIAAGGNPEAARARLGAQPNGSSLAASPPPGC